MLASLKYARITIVHKYFVFLAGLRVKVPLWQLIIHDFSKFTTSELSHYGRQFFGDKNDPDGFNRAWLHHQNINLHHWEYWIPRTTHYAGSSIANEPMRMPEKYMREMVADWMGANRAYEGEYAKSLSDWAWFKNSFDGLTLHEKTREEVLEVLAKAGLC